MPGELNEEIASEAVGRLDDDRLSSVARYRGEHRSEPGASVNRISTADGLVVELGGDAVAGALGEGGDCSALTLAAVLLGARIRRELVRK